MELICETLSFVEAAKSFNDLFRNDLKIDDTCTAVLDGRRRMSGLRKHSEVAASTINGALSKPFGLSLSLKPDERIRP